MSVLLAGGLLLATLSPSATPAERRSAAAETAIAQDPGSVRPQVDLAMALARRARETSDPTFYAKADEALGRALEKTPDDYEALRARVWIRLGQHRFAEARDEAQRLQRSGCRSARPTTCSSTASWATRTWSSATTRPPRRRSSGC
jgi:hypothetical protein